MGTKGTEDTQSEGSFFAPFVLFVAKVQADFYPGGFRLTPTQVGFEGSA
jgi:hypothetical protein